MRYFFDWRDRTDVAMVRGSFFMLPEDDSTSRLDEVGRFARLAQGTWCVHEVIRSEAYRLVDLSATLILTFFQRYSLHLSAWQYDEGLND